MIDGTDVDVGDEIVSAEFGPFTIIDTVRWSGVQENPERIHWDREFAREHSRLRSFIVSGGHRQALLARALTDWLGPTGRLVRMQVRHVAPTFEGDTIRFSARVRNKANQPDGTALECEVEGRNQDQKPVLAGSCVLLLTAAQLCRV